MRRLPATLSLTAIAALTLTTAAIAAPPGTGADDCPMSDAAAMAAMHADPDAMMVMHGHMLATHPEMAAHLDGTDIDADQMRDWMAAGLDHEEMHVRMLDAGVDLEAMHANCPMTDGAMPHGDGMPRGDHHR